MSDLKTKITALIAVIELTESKVGLETLKEIQEEIRWIPVGEKLPTIGVTPYQVECKSKMNGQIETYWIEYDSQYLISVCSHWRLIL